MKIIVTAIVTLVVLAIAAYAYAYSGGYNVAASDPHTPWMRSFLDTTFEHSVKAHAKGIQAPALDDPAMVREGAHDFGEECEQCHGAPGVKPGELAKGMRPDPPELGRASKEWKPEELFWVAKHGVKMTGMPAWGAVHDDATLWKIVAFIEAMPKMSAEQYAQLAHGGKEGAQGKEGEATTEGPSGEGHAAQGKSGEGTGGEAHEGAGK